VFNGQCCAERLALSTVHGQADNSRQQPALLTGSMRTSMTNHMKTRVTISVEKELLRAAEKRARGKSRSQIIEDALRAAERLARVTQTIEYYRDEEAIKDDGEWREVEALSAAAIFGEGHTGRSGE
jgi:hypothetical protein